MRLLLTSDGLGALTTFVDPKENPRIAVITDAVDTDEYELSLQFDFEQMRRMGFRFVKRVSLVESAQEVLNTFSDQFDVAALMGGNQHRLMKALRHTRFAEPLTEMVKSGAIDLVGKSAGSIDIGTRPDYPEDILTEWDDERLAVADAPTTGLALVPFHPVPHMPAAERYKAMAVMTARGELCLPIKDGMAILIEDDLLQVVPSPMVGQPTIPGIVSL